MEEEQGKLHPLPRPYRICSPWYSGILRGGLKIFFLKGRHYINFPMCTYHVYLQAFLFALSFKFLTAWQHWMSTSFLWRQIGRKKCSIYLVKIEKNYRATRVYKYILQSEDCIVLHWGKGNRFRSLRPTFLEDKLKEKESMTRLYTIADSCLIILNHFFTLTTDWERLM